MIPLLCQFPALLTQIGKWGRDCNKDFWVILALNKAEKLMNDGNFVIIVDLRFKNEMNHVKKLNKKIIRIIRPEIGFTTNDQSETDLDDVPLENFDKIVINDGFESLRKAAKDIINQYIL